MNKNLKAQLVSAAQSEDDAQVRSLMGGLQAKDVDDPEVQKAYLYACGCCSADIIEAFLSLGVDVNLRRGDINPVIAASIMANCGALAALLRSGGDANSVARIGEPVICLVCSRLAKFGPGNYDGYSEVVQMLLLAGARPNDVGPNLKTTALESACCIGPLTNSDSIAIPQSLIAHGADPNVFNTTEGRPPLTHAAIRGNPRLLKLLLDSGAIVNAIDHDQRTAVSFATLFHRHDNIKILVEHGASLDVVDTELRGPLEIAVDEDDGFALESLLQAIPQTSEVIERRNALLARACRCNSIHSMSVLTEWSSSWG
jgi:uncharacterized protein